MTASEILINGKPVKDITIDDSLFWEKYPELLDGLVAWYDIKKLKCTNESLLRDPRLIDFSGNENHALLFNFKFNETNDGIIEDYRLKFDGGYAYIPTLLNLDNITVICKRKSNGYLYACATFQGEGFVFEGYHMFGNKWKLCCLAKDKIIFNPFNGSDDEVSWMNNNYFNGNPITDTDRPSTLPNKYVLFADTHPCTRWVRGILDKIMIFNRNLSYDSIQEIINLYFTE